MYLRKRRYSRACLGSP